jgi:hypothetical protein
MLMYLYIAHISPTLIALDEFSVHALFTLLQVSRTTWRFHVMTNAVNGTESGRRQICRAASVGVFHGMVVDTCRTLR